MAPRAPARRQVPRPVPASPPIAAGRPSSRHHPASRHHRGRAAANVMPSAPPSPPPAATTATVQTAVSAAPTSDDVDRKLQSRTMWVSVKQEFPDWYQARVAEVARLSSEQKDQAEISRYLIGE